MHIILYFSNNNLHWINSDFKPFHTCTGTTISTSAEIQQFPPFQLQMIPQFPLTI